MMDKLVIHSSKSSSSLVNPEATIVASSNKKTINASAIPFWSITVKRLLVFGKFLLCFTKLLKLVFS